MSEIIRVPRRGKKTLDGIQIQDEKNPEPRLSASQMISLRNANQRSKRPEPSLPKFSWDDKKDTDNG